LVKKGARKPKTGVRGGGKNFRRGDGGVIKKGGFLYRNEGIREVDKRGGAV